MAKGSLHVEPDTASSRQPWPLVNARACMAYRTEYGILEFHGCAVGLEQKKKAGSKVGWKEKKSFSNTMEFPLRICFVLSSPVIHTLSSWHRRSSGISRSPERVPAAVLTRQTLNLQQSKDT